MPKTLLEQLQEAVENLVGAKAEPAPLRKPLTFSRKDHALMAKPSAALTRNEANRRRTLRDCFGVAPYSDDPAIDAALSDEVGECFREADLALAGLIAHADPLIQDAVTGRAQAFLQELLRLAHEGAGE